ncbi:hypothetical protein YC2023_086816 [Brassica napus]
MNIPVNLFLQVCVDAFSGSLENKLTVSGSVSPLDNILFLNLNLSHFVQCIFSAELMCLKMRGEQVFMIIRAMINILRQETWTDNREAGISEGFFYMRLEKIFSLVDSTHQGASLWNIPDSIHIILGETISLEDHKQQGESEVVHALHVVSIPFSSAANIPLAD